MSALTWLRVARRVRGLSAQRELPNLEALLEAEAGQPSNDFRIAARVVPPVMCFVGAIFLTIALATHFYPMLAGVVLFGVAAGVLWKVFDHMDRKISPSKARLRKLADVVMKRYSGFGNIVGLDPALSPTVGEVLDQAAAIYMKHSAATPSKDSKLFADSQAKAVRALEDAMARMMELAEPQGVRAQELELSKGWARQLLQEMRGMDRALDAHAQSLAASSVAGAIDPMAGLREARLELQRIDTAVDELEQNRIQG